MPGIDFREVRRLVSMSEVLQPIGFEPRTGAGPQYRGPCPVHHSGPTSRSLEVHVQRQLYHCFVCGSAGNHLDLYAAATRQRLYDAASTFVSGWGTLCPGCAAAVLKGRLRRINR